MEKMKKLLIKINIKNRTKKGKMKTLVIKNNIKNVSNK